jgi:hypothetical protein
MVCEEDYTIKVAVFVQLTSLTGKNFNGRKRTLLDKSIKLAIAIILWSFIGLMALGIIVGLVNIISTTDSENDEVLLLKGEPTPEQMECLNRSNISVTYEQPKSGPERVLVNPSDLAQAKKCVSSGK